MAVYTYQQALNRGLALDLGNIGMVEPYTYRGVGIKYPYGSGTTPASEVSPYSKTDYAIRGDVRNIINYNEWLKKEAGGANTPQPESFWQKQIDLATRLAGRAQNTGYSFYEYLGRPGGGRNVQILEKIKELSQKGLKTVKEQVGREIGERRAVARKTRRTRGGGLLSTAQPLSGETVGSAIGGLGEELTV